MDSDRAIEFAREWEAAWNRRDLEAVLKHFHEDVLFTSSVAQQIGFSEDGVVRGKDALRQYWTIGLAKTPDLRFQIRTVYFGMNTLVLLFRNQKGMDRAEVLTFRDGFVTEGHGMCAAG